MLKPLHKQMADEHPVHLHASGVGVSSADLFSIPDLEGSASTFCDCSPVNPHIALRCR